MHSRMTIAAALIALPLTAASARADWVVESFDTVPGGFDNTAAGDGRSDGVPRLYATAAGLAGTVYEYTAIGGAWQRTATIATGSPRSVHQVALGALRPDGVVRVYGAVKGGGASPGEVVECAFQGGAFSCAVIAQLPGEAALWPIVADGRNDGVRRLYVGCDASIREYTFAAGGWAETSLIPENGHVFDVGDGRGDGVSRVYSSSQPNDPTSGPGEFTWDGSAFVRTAMGTAGGDVSVGSADGLGHAVYAGGTDADPMTYAYERVNGAWRQTPVVATGTEAMPRVGAVRAGGPSLFIAGGDDELVRECRPGANGFACTAIATLDNYASGLLIADARGEGRHSVYVAAAADDGPGGNGSLYELHWED